jgi:hypothetical protein
LLGEIDPAIAMREQNSRGGRVACTHGTNDEQTKEHIKANSHLGVLSPRNAPLQPGGAVHYLYESKSPVRELAIWAKKAKRKFRSTATLMARRGK